VPVLEALKEGTLFELAHEAAATALEPAVAAPEPAVAIAAPAAAPTPEPYLVQALEPSAAGAIVAASAGEEEESFSLDLPAFGSLKRFLHQADAVAKTRPVVARLKKVIEEDASAGLMEPGTDLRAFIKA
jgi:type IV secretion system protein VirD4